MIVYILFHETNSGRSDESDGYVEAVYSNEAAAEAAKLAHIRALVAEGEAVYWDPDSNTEDSDEWEHDFHIEHFTVLDQ